MNPSQHIGAIRSPRDARDYIYEDVAFGAPPFDWSVGCDSSAICAGAIKVKDQNGSGSCGGQSEAYIGAVLSALHDGVYEEKSAKFTYAPVAQQGGGSSGRDLATRSITAGWGSESLTLSYENGQPPSEAFMENVADITPDAINRAKRDHALNYVLIGLNIDTIAQAIRDYKVVRLGVVGSNNGTWLSTDPVAPAQTDTLWYHWVCAMKAQMRNGRKAIGFINSWGANVGDNGWQWLSEDYINKPLQNANGTTPIFEPRCYVWNPIPAPAMFRHTFSTNLSYGMISPEVINLQMALTIDGTFPAGVPYSQCFGNVTLQAVQKFQVKYNIATVGGLGYGLCGPFTRAKLNSIFE